MRGYDYDAYISFVDGDAAWVDSELAPRMTLRSLRHLDARRFTLGRPELDERARAVKSSRRTVLILTKAYLEDANVKQDSLLAATSAIKKQEWRVIPVKRQECELPDWLDLLVNIDMSSPDEADWDRLIFQLIPTDLPQGLEEIKETGETAREGLLQLKAWWADPAVKQSLQDYQGRFQEAALQIRLLADYKALHDGLHQLQIHAHEILSAEQGRFPADEAALDRVDASRLIVRDVLAIVKEVRERKSEASESTLWIGNLNTVSDHLRAACDDRSLDDLENAVALLGRLLTVQPTRINVRLLQAARKLRKIDLTDALRRVARRLQTLDVPQDEMGRFDPAIRTFESLVSALPELLEAHDLCQAADLDVRRIQAAFRERSEGLRELQDTWGAVRMVTGPLLEDGDDAWSEETRRIGMELDSGLHSLSSDELHALFRKYARRFNKYFSELDARLKAVCEGLRAAASPLSEALGLLL